MKSTRIWTTLVLALLLLSSSKLAFAVKGLKLSIPKNQDIVILVPQSQWEAKDTSASGIPIFVLGADQGFIKNRFWENGSVPLLIAFHIEKARDCGSGVMSGRIIGCPLKWKEIELRSEKAWLKIQFPPEVSDVEAALKELAFIGSVAQFENTNYLHDRVFLPNQKRLLQFVDGRPVEGLAFHLHIPAYNFVTGGETKFDDLLVYLTTDELKKFATSDITSQKLIDASFVLLNNDRVEAKL